MVLCHVQVIDGIKSGTGNRWCYVLGCMPSRTVSSSSTPQILSAQSVSPQTNTHSRLLQYEENTVVQTTVYLQVLFLDSWNILPLFCLFHRGVPQSSVGLFYCYYISIIVLIVLNVTHTHVVFNGNLVLKS